MQAPASVAVTLCAALYACAGAQAGEDEAAGAGSGAASAASEAGAGGAAIDGTAGNGDAGRASTPAATAGSNAGSAGTTAAPATGGSGNSGGMAGAGETAASGGGGNTASGGLPPPDPSVTFDWPATLPGGDDDCRPGHYTGTFSCDYRLAPTDPDPLVVVTGPISLTLERSQDGEFLEISDGQLEGIAQLVIGFRSQLAGRLDCAIGELLAEAVDGIWGFGDPAVLPFGVFAGTLTGALDTASATLDGQWDLGVNGGAATGGGACVGPWQANWAP
jgi:hypothetical protein